MTDLAELFAQLSREPDLDAPELRDSILPLVFVGCISDAFDDETAAGRGAVDEARRSR